MIYVTFRSQPRLELRGEEGEHWPFSGGRVCRSLRSPTTEGAFMRLLRLAVRPGLVVALLALGSTVPGLAAAAPSGSSAVVPVSRAEAQSRPVLRAGASGVWVRRLHRALGIVPARQPFGAATERAVRAFRVAHGLSDKPVVSVRMWMLLGSPATASEGGDFADRPTLRQGDSSAWVQALQVALAVQPASGYFGPVTAAAVERFQAESGLAVTGIVNRATWQALGSRVAAPATDVTTTTAARTSRNYRQSIGVTAFASSATAQMVVQRESGGQCDVSDPSGKYRGKWQMDSNFWSAYGGREFAATPDQATCAEQDIVAYRGWVDRWWQPWSTTAS